jgi:hypothetical protein
MAVLPHTFTNHRETGDDPRRDRRHVRRDGTGQFGKLNCEKFDPRGAAARPFPEERRNSTSINFDIASGSKSARNTYLRYLIEDNSLRGLYSTGNALTLQSHLRALLCGWCRTRNARARNRPHAWMAKPEFSAVCHRKFITIFLAPGEPCSIEASHQISWVGLSNHENGNEGFRAPVQAAINRSILGNDGRPLGWQLPYDPVKKVITTISLDNVWTRKVIARMADT